MTCFRRCLLPLLVVLLLAGCKSTDPYQDPFRVITDTAIIRERSDVASRVLTELKFGDEVLCRESNPSYTLPKGWIQARVGKMQGFMERKALASEDTYAGIQTMLDDGKNKEAQATGLLGKKVALRAKPDKGAFALDSFAEPTRVDILERVWVTPGVDQKARRQLWYQVRAPNGHVGFVTASNVSLTPPREINVYTQVRQPVTWYTLGEKSDPKTGEKGKDYLVTYLSAGAPADADFTRVEVYVYDPAKKIYGTSLAKADLFGKLPVMIMDAPNGGKMIEITEYPKGDAKKMHVMQYSYPPPIKMVKDTVETR